MPTDPLDPLLSPGAEPSGDVGEPPIVLPGHDRPEWVLPVLVVAFGALIAWLAIFEADDTERLATADDPAAVVADAGTTSTPPASAAAPSEEAPSASVASDAASTPVGSAGQDLGGQDVDDGGVIDPVGDAAAAAGASDTGGVELDLPPVGSIRVGDTDYELTASCVGLQPLAPNDTESTVSAHAFRPDGGPVQVVERWFTADGIDGVRLDGPGAAGVRQVDVTDGTVPGSFAAVLEQPDGGVVEIAVHPLAEAAQDCSQVVVTNAPGQFAFPYTRAALDVCVDGDPRVDGRLEAILTEGARMIAEANGDETHTLTLRTAETLLSPSADLVDERGALFADGEQLGYSGLVADGDTSFDLTFDVDVSGARSCDGG